jgi:hypothetical protein
MDRVIERNWGYAVIHEGKIWIPAIIGNMGEILRDLHKKTGITKMIFSAVLNPESFKTHLKNIVKEWDEWYDEMGDYSHCIEIEFNGE